MLVHNYLGFSRLEVCLGTAESAVQVPSYRLSLCKHFRNTETEMPVFLEHLRDFAVQPAE